MGIETTVEKTTGICYKVLVKVRLRNIIFSVSIQCDLIQKMQVFDLSGFCNKAVAAALGRTYARVLINQISAS